MSVDGRGLKHMLIQAYAYINVWMAGRYDV